MSAFSSEWSPRSQPPQLGRGEIHVWRISLAIEEDPLARLYDVLVSNEQDRADRFLHADVRRRFVAARGQMRRLIAAYLDEPADRIEFAYSGLGKPRLATDREPAFHFNLSHSGECALFACTREGELGVDVEQLRAVRDQTGLARRFFSPPEYRRLVACRSAEQQAEFFRIWTRKEAILKATGKGLTFPLSQLTVSSEANRPAALEALGDDPLEPPRWTLQHLEPGEPYVGALAARFTWERLTLACWSP